MSTVRAAFGRRVKLVYLDEVTPIPLGFVLQLAHKLPPANITDGFRQAVVLQQVLDLQALETDRLVLTNELCRELVLIVTPSIGNSRMKTSDFHTRFCPVLTALFLLGKVTLGTGQFLLILVEELGVAMGVSSRGDDHGLEPQVQPHL